MTKFENATLEQVEEFIKKWLVDEKYGLKPHPDPESFFNYRIVKAQMSVNIGQPRESEDSIMIVGRIVFNEQEQNMLRYLKVKRELLYELDIIFALANVDFSLKPNVTTQEFTIEDIQLSRVIYYDALSKQTLYDMILLIFNCLKLIVTKFALVGRQPTT